MKFAAFDPNTDIGGDTTETWTFGVNCHIKGGDLKIQLNHLPCDIPAPSNNRTRSSSAARPSSDPRPILVFTP